jgi:hypothetical protein
MTNEQPSTIQISSRLLTKLRGAIASALVLALLLTALPPPASAKWQDLSGTLPGGVSKGVVIGVGAAAAGLVGLLIYYKVHHKGITKVKLDAPAVRFDGAVSGQPTKQSVPVTNLMSEPVTVKAVSVEDTSGALAIDAARQVPFTLAPGEKFEIPVTLTANNAGGKAHLRIVATTEKLNKDGVKVIEVSYGHHKSKLKKLIP